MSVNFSNTTPAAPAGNTNVLWQNDGSGNISAYLSSAASLKTSVDLTAKTANISATTLLAVTSSGFYRVSAYIIVTTVDAVSSTMPKVTITWTDPNNSTGQTKDITATSAGNVLTTFDQGAVLFNAKSTTNIQYATSGYASNTPATMQYAVSLRLEAL